MDSSSVRSTRNGSASPRARRKACQYCFRRKMKCDMLEPSCTNCLNNGKECVPGIRADRPRPTNERIYQLEEDVNNLRTFLHTISAMSPESSTQALTRWERSGSTDVSVLSTNIQGAGAMAEQIPLVTTPARYRQEAALGYSTESRIQSPVNPVRYTRGGISAHGPTSAFFDELGERDFGGFDPAHEGSSQVVSEADLRDRATARCAEERHMEILNLAAGKLDFDGVPPDLAMHLLALHWNRQHFAFLISYRPLFTRDMACSGPYFSKLLLNAIFFSVSKFSDRPEVYDDPTDQKTAGKRFLRRVKELLGEALDQSSIPTIQAMLLLSSSLFALGNQSAAWLYSGIAIRMIFDLGLQYDSIHRVTLQGQMTAEEVEIRRRVVWAAFIYDKIISLYQGRAVSFDESQIHVPHRFFDRYEEQELWTPFAFPGIQRYPGAPARAISTFTSLCSLSVVMGRIITYIYAEQDSCDQPADHLKRLSAALERWKRSLPLEIAFNPSSEDDQVPPPHVLSLHAVYYTLVTLLHRPFVETGHRQHSDPSIVELSWAQCEEAAKGATAVLQRYRQTFSLARAPYLISYTTYVAATIHVRIAAQRGARSEAGQLLSVCLEALQENSATNPGVRKMHSTIVGVMERLNVHLIDPGSAQSLTVQPEVLPDDLDLSAIIRSFGADPAAYNSLALPEMSAYSFEGMDQPLDNLYGFLGFD